MELVFLGQRDLLDLTDRLSHLILWLHFFLHEKDAGNHILIADTRLLVVTAEEPKNPHISNGVGIQTDELIKQNANNFRRDQFLGEVVLVVKQFWQNIKDVLLILDFQDVDDKLDAILFDFVVELAQFEE